MKNGDKPAYPIPINPGQKWVEVDDPDGLTKRERFAMAAMQGLMVQSIPGSHNSNSDRWNQERARFAVAMADALLTELEKQKR